MSENNLAKLISEADQLVEKKEYEKARAIYFEVAKEGEALAFLRLGDLSKREGLLKDAYKHYERANQINPYDQEIIAELKQRDFHDFILESLIQTKNVKSLNPKYNQLGNSQLMKKHWFSGDLEVCAHTIWLVVRLLGGLILAIGIILLFTSVEKKLTFFFSAIITSSLFIISGWVAKTLMIGFGVIVRNQEDEINQRINL